MRQFITQYKRKKIEPNNHNKINQTPHSRIKTVLFYLFSMYLLPIVVSISIGISFAIVEEITGIEYDIFALSKLISNSKVYIYLFTYIVMTTYIFKKYKVIYYDAFKKIKKLNLIKKSVLLSVLVWGIKAATMNILEMFGAKMPHNQILIQDLATNNFLIITIMLTIMAPFIEEIIFRHIIQNSTKRFGNIISILISSTIFSLMHYSGGNMIPIINYFVSGLCFGIIYNRTKNISIVLIVHAVNNFINFMILYYYL